MVVVEREAARDEGEQDDSARPDVRSSAVVGLALKRRSVGIDRGARKSVRRRLEERRSAASRKRFP